MSQRYGAFHIQAKADQNLIWCGPPLPGQEITAVRQDSTQRELIIQRRSLLPFIERVQKIPFGALSSIHLIVHRTETPGELLPLLLCFDYQTPKRKPAQLKIRAFIEKVDCVQKAKEFFFELARHTATPSTEAGAFRTHAASLEFGFYTEHRLQEELRLIFKGGSPIPEVWEPEQSAELELRLHREQIQGALKIPESEHIQSDYPTHRYEPPTPPSFRGMLRSDLKYSPRIEYALLLLIWPAWLAYVLMYWIEARQKYDARHVTYWFAVWGALRFMIGSSMIIFAVGKWLLYANTEHLSQSFLLLAPLVYFLINHLRKKQALKRWPSIIAERAAQRGQILSGAVLSIAVVSWTLTLLR